MTPDGIVGVVTRYYSATRTAYAISVAVSVKAHTVVVISGSRARAAV
jgi:hypothetical protein